RWAEALIVVKPDTAVSWHRAGFRLYWRFLSRRRLGRPRITSDLRGLIRRIASENPLWGAPRVHGELLKLGFEVSERTVSRYLRRLHGGENPGKRWLSLLRNHREVIAAMDFCLLSNICGLTLARGADQACDRARSPSLHRCENRKSVWSSPGFCC